MIKNANVEEKLNKYNTESLLIPSKDKITQVTRIEQHIMKYSNLRAGETETLPINTSFLILTFHQKSVNIELVGATFSLKL